MVRKGWQSLSAGYRERLERKGISQSDYDRGIPLAPARGHGQTPEKPHDYDPTKYQKYHSERTRLETELDQRKQQLFGMSPKWSSTRSMHNIREYPPSLSKMRWAINADDEELLDAFREAPNEYSWLGYH